HATGGDRMAASKTNGTAWHPNITRDKTGEWIVHSLTTSNN
ncbi:hypothetical protein ACGGW2_004981, partial [Salmonella enterica]